MIFLNNGVSLLVRVAIKSNIMYHYIYVVAIGGIMKCTFQEKLYRVDHPLEHG